MAERGRQLAAELATVNAEALDFLSAIGDDEWGAKTPHEGWTVGVTAMHIADLYPETVALAQRVATGQPLAPTTQADIDQANHDRAARFANATLAETVDALRRNGAAAAEAIAALTDDQLGQSAMFFGLYPWTAEAVVEGLMIAHTRTHLHSIQQAVEVSRAHNQRRRAQRLAERLEAQNDEVIAFVEGLDDAQWRQPTANEKWSVAVAAHHIAAVYPDVVDLVQRVASGRPLPKRSQADIDATNEAHAREHAAPARAEVVELMRLNGARAAAAIRELPDESLDRSALFFGAFPWTAEAVVEGLMIGHARNHLHSMRQGVAGATPH